MANPPGGGRHDGSSAGQGDGRAAAPAPRPPSPAGWGKADGLRSSSLRSPRRSPRPSRRAEENPPLLPAAALLPRGPTFSGRLSLPRSATQPEHSVPAGLRGKGSPLAKSLWPWR